MIVVQSSKAVNQVSSVESVLLIDYKCRNQVMLCSVFLYSTNLYSARNKTRQCLDASQYRLFVRVRRYNEDMVMRALAMEIARTRVERLVCDGKKLY